jgi:hypothetical protein
MAIVKTKGTLLKMCIAGGTLATIAQMISIDVAEAKTETYDATTLDQAGVGKVKKPTGYTDGGSISGELFFDPALAGHQTITDILLAPSIPVGEEHLVDGGITFADTATTAWTFVSSGVGFGVAVAMNDGLKGSVSFECGDVIGYAT